MQTQEEAERQAEEERKAREKSALMERRLKDERCLIFQNLMNGVPAWKVAEAFHKDSKEVMDIFHFVVRKIRSWCLERKDRPILGFTIDEVQKYRRRCLAILPLLNLDKEPRYAKIIDEHIEIKADGTARNIDVLRQIAPQ